MTIYRITSADVESFTIATNPLRHYVSSSNQQTTGSIYVFPRRSLIEKDATPASSYVDAAHDDADISSILLAAQKNGSLMRSATSTLSASFFSVMNSYMSAVDNLGPSLRKSKTVDIVRFTPSTSFTMDTLRKLLVKDTLNTHYRSTYPNAHYAYTNYSALNFFSSSLVPAGAALLYPNIDANPQPHVGYVPGVYSLSGAFSFDFYVNVRRTTESIDVPYRAGTIFHLSSSYAVSIISGSSKDITGRTNAFRLQLQLSHSADVKPSSAIAGTYPNDLIFTSDNNSLQLGRWHHVVIRWGTNVINNGTGSFNIDSIERGVFVVPSGTITPLTGASRQPSVLVVGNYYAGTNDGLSGLDYFFATDPATRDGLVELNSTPAVDEPITYSFTNPLNAELHDVAIKRYYMSDQDVATPVSHGPDSVGSDVAFYLPPFFVHESPIRTFVGTYGGVPQTPFFEVRNKIYWICQLIYTTCN